jgi:hypothetical protein
MTEARKHAGPAWREAAYGLLLEHGRQMTTWLAIYKLQQKQKRHNFVTSVTLSGPVLEQF